MTDDLKSFLSDPVHSIALRAFVDAGPMDAGHQKRSQKLFNKYYERDKKMSELQKAIEALPDYRMEDENGCQREAAFKDEVIKIIRQHEAMEAAPWVDTDDEYTADIDAACDYSKLNHTLYAKAFQMVSNRHGKFALVNLVYWLLTKAEDSQLLSKQEVIATLLDEFEPLADYDGRPDYNAAVRNCIAAVKRMPKANTVMGDDGGLVATHLGNKISALNTKTSPVSSPATSEASQQGVDGATLTKKIEEWYMEVIHGQHTENGTEFANHVIKHLRQQPAAQVSDAAKDVLAERKRQIEQEGWLPEHDDKYDAGELVSAAATYALQINHANPLFHRIYWPWKLDWFKPTTPRRDLVKAAALLVAEIERLDRAALQQKEG